MGNKATNGRDSRIDNAIVREVFGLNSRDNPVRGGYNAEALANDARNPISYQQQLNALGARFDTAKDMYRLTGEHKYLMMQTDLRNIASSQFDIDGREWRPSSRRGK